MPNVDINGTVVSFPDDMQPDQLKSAVSMAAGKMGKIQKPPSALNQSMGQYNKSQFGSPQQMLGMVPNLLSNLAGKAGEGLATHLAGKGVNPYVSAGLGTAAAMGPDIAMAAANPISDAPNTIPDAAIPLQRRAYGFQKSFLKTPFARGKASMAAKTGLEQGITSATGNPDVMMGKASDLAAKSGQQLGNIRSSVGPQPIDHFVDALDNYKSARLRGASGGKWDAISNKIDEAKQTILGILGQEKNSPIKRAGGFSIPGEKGTPLQFSPGSEPIPGRRNPATGFVEGEIPGTKGSYFGGRPETPGVDVPNSVVGGNRGSMMGIFTPPEKVDLNRIAEAKKEIGKTVNWFMDNVGHDEAKKLTGVLEKATEQAIASAGGDIKTYKALKSIYGAMKSIQKGLNNEIAGQQGNMAVSLPSQIMGGVGAAATGHIGGAIKATGITELLRRRGAGIGASELIGAANAPRKLGISAVQALQSFRRKKKNENPNP